MFHSDQNAALNDRFDKFREQKKEKRTREIAFLLLLPHKTLFALTFERRTAKNRILFASNDSSAREHKRP